MRKENRVSDSPSSDVQSQWPWRAWDKEYSWDYLCYLQLSTHRLKAQILHEKALLQVDLCYSAFAKGTGALSEIVAWGLLLTDILVVVQWLSHIRLFGTPQCARLLCPPLPVKVSLNSCPLSWWCYLTIYPLLSFYSFAFHLSQHWGLFQWVNPSHQVAASIGVSASIPVLPVNIQGWFPLGLIGLISLQSKGLRSLLQ